ncbi:MAG TPA: hypothetical protein VMS99_06665, partial [Acidimicrobiia bacterium]|nr:hypothetical protein [Acidimicrobiia bacterium]
MAPFPAGPNVSFGSTAVDSIRLRVISGTQRDGVAPVGGGNASAAWTRWTSDEEQALGQTGPS